MSIWVLQQNLSTEDEAQFEARTLLTLPFGDLPDLSRVTSQQHLQQLLYTLHPDEPPETIQRKADRVWPRYRGLNKEDIIAVLLPQRKEVALMEVVGAYQYRVGVSGSDEHLIPVKHLKTIKLSTLRKHKYIFESGDQMMEVMRAEARIALRDKLPYSYNRFAKWKWLMVIFFLMGLVRFFVRMDR